MRFYIDTTGIHIRYIHPPEPHSCPGYGTNVRGVNVTDVYARGVNVNLTPLTSNRGAPDYF